MEADSIRWKQGIKSSRRQEEEGNPDTWGHGVSEGGGRKTRMRETGLVAVRWARPKRRAGAGGKVGRARKEAEAHWRAKYRVKLNFLFFFFF
jgi:hypothetical protein